MKKILIVAVLLLCIYTVKAQILNPVKWSYAAKRLNAKEAVIFLKAAIDNGWHIYSQHVGDNGPTKTEFAFSPAKSYKLIGTVAEPKGNSKYEKSFEMQVTYFEKEVIFQQKIKLLSANQTVIKGKLKYGTCNDHQCLPPEDVRFTVIVR
jgi:DsbC/DsbD-like thiol-disulfide interchange protein